MKPYRLSPSATRYGQYSDIPTSTSAQNAHPLAAAEKALDAQAQACLEG
ncbi:hypothetical protein ACLEIY_05825 [Acetobacter tropicalis]